MTQKKNKKKVKKKLNYIKEKPIPLKPQQHRCRLCKERVDDHEWICVVNIFNTQTREYFNDYKFVFHQDCWNILFENLPNIRSMNAKKIKLSQH